MVMKSVRQAILLNDTCFNCSEDIYRRYLNTVQHPTGFARYDAK